MRTARASTFHGAVLLDAAFPVCHACARLEVHAAGAWVVVRRQVGLGLTFYVFRADQLLADLARVGTDSEMTLQTTLRFDERDAALAVQHADVRRLQPDAVCVVLEGTSVVGVWEPPPLPERAGPSRSTRGVGRLVVRRPKREPPRMRGSGRGSGAAAPPADALTPDGLASVAPAAAASPPAPSPMAPGALDPEPAPVQFNGYAQLGLEKDVIEPGERFELSVGLGHEAQPEVAGGAISAQLPAGTTEFDLDVKVIADGFDAPNGWHFRLHVPVADPERARLSIPLIAPRDDVVRLSVLEVHFTYRGMPCGFAFRRIAVQPHDQARDAIAATNGIGATSSSHTPWVGVDAAVSAAPLHIDPADPQPDLTITISKPDGNGATGRYCWGFASPHDVPLPRGPITMDLGDDARTFAGRMIQLVTRAEGTPLIDQALNGLGRQVRDKAPDELEDVLLTVWRAVQPAGRVPTVLLHSAEPHVPWELARLDDPPDPAAPPFLGAQFAVGRWILGPRGMRVPPPREVNVRAMAVVAGDYRSSLNLRPLPQAESEGVEIERRWGAVRLAASIDSMNSLLEATLEKEGAHVGGADAIHFACHGEIDARNPRDAMIFLDNDWPLDPSLFLDAPVGRSHQPFLFLNACQIGQAGETLGDYSGFAGCCLRAGFRGFVAPLWSVSDDIAHTIALEFYERAFDGGQATVAEILRDLRGRYPAGERVPASTWLAYVFYGNPAFRLRRATE